MRYLKKVLAALVVGIVIYILGHAYIGFNWKGLDSWMQGQTAEDLYPDWEKDVEVLEADRGILDKSHLFLSRVYLIRHMSNYQIRFRIAYSIPFMHDNLLWDTSWVKLTDSYGNDYSDCLTVYASEISGLNCVNAVLAMDQEAFSALSGGRLTVSVVCSDDGQKNGSPYAHCEAEILVPEMD